jgi:hypothetical protein
MHKKIRETLLLFLAIFLVLFAEANNGKNPSPIQGYVTDAITKKPVSGVLVSASAPSVNSSKEVITDEDGYFRFEQLPANTVNLQFDKKGYQPIKKTGIQIKEKVLLRVNIEFFQDESMEINDDSEYPLLRVLQMD